MNVMYICKAIAIGSGYFVLCLMVSPLLPVAGLMWIAKWVHVEERPNIVEAPAQCMSRVKKGSELFIVIGRVPKLTEQWPDQ